MSPILVTFQISTLDFNWTMNLNQVFLSHPDGVNPSLKLQHPLIVTQINMNGHNNRRLLVIVRSTHSWWDKRHFRATFGLT